MAIIKVTSDTAIEPGKYVHGPSPLSYGTHSAPRKVTRLAGKRVHYELGNVESFMHRSAVLLICDTEDEGFSVVQLSNDRHDDITAQINCVLEASGYEYEVRLNALIGGAA